MATSFGIHACGGLRARGGVAGAQQTAQHVARLGTGGDQRVVDPVTDMAVVLTAWLFTVGSEREAVDIDGHHSRRRCAGCGPPPRGKLQRRGVDHRLVGGLGEEVQQPRERGLRSQRLAGGSHTTPVTAGEGEQGVVAQALRVALIAPALGDHGNSLAQQLRE